MTPQRFYSLDVLRGAAALSVVLWHWQHFFAPLNSQGIPLETERQPFFPLLSFFYQHGFTAVELFFCLSGFIFFWLYGTPVSHKYILFGRFAALRLSRLYPLHLSTLLFVALCQYIYRQVFHAYFVYPLNDGYHFFLNLLFISSWGFQKGYSFNAPIWSVSVEIFLYCVFFFLCRLVRPNLLAVLPGLAAGCLLLNPNHPLGLGLVYFFLGGLSYTVYHAIVQMHWPTRLDCMLSVLTLMAWIASVWVAAPDRHLVIPPGVRMFGDDAFSLLSYLLFPLTILSLALVETRRGSLGRRIAFIGDISYSSYLLHFPLQLVFAASVGALALQPQIFYSRSLFLLFFAILSTAAYMCHRWFEMPVQRWLRSRYAPATTNRMDKCAY